MKIHDVEQLSDEWFKLHEMRMSASHATAIKANGKGLKTYITGLMQEYYSTAKPDRYDNKDMQRGLELEDSAALLYEIETGLETHKVGFVEYSQYVGCSPDLFVVGKGMAEIKCPADKVYFEYLLDRKIDSKYWNQMQMQMLICEKLWCDYIVYNPNFEKKIIIQRVEQDFDAITSLEIGFRSGEKLIKEIEEKVSQFSNCKDIHAEDQKTEISDYF